MTRPFRFAVQLMNWADRDAIVRAAREAEALGYDEIYSYDHFGTVDPCLPLMVAAEATTRLKVGPLVLNNEFHHPALLARSAATAQRLTGGRFVLGIGTGYAQAEHDAIGLPLREPGPRVDRLGESLAVLRDLLDEGVATHDGQHHQVTAAGLGVEAGDRVPFLIGGYGRRVVALGAEFADIFQFTGLSHGPAGDIRVGGFGIEAVRRRAKWLSEAAGSRDDNIERSALVQFLAVGGDADGAVAARLAQAGLPPEVAVESPFVLVGSVEQLVDRLERHRQELGINHIVVRDAVAFAPVIEALAGS